MRLYSLLESCLLYTSHLVMEPGQSCYEPVIALFGRQIIKNDKTIDRRQVSDVVFSHPELLEKLNQIIHPAVKQYIREQLAIKKQQGQKICVVEAALLLEDHYQEFCDTIWYIPVSYTHLNGGKANEP